MVYIVNYIETQDYVERPSLKKQKNKSIKKTFKSVCRLTIDIQSAREACQGKVCLFSR